MRANTILYLTMTRKKDMRWEATMDKGPPSLTLTQLKLEIPDPWVEIRVTIPNFFSKIIKLDLVPEGDSNYMTVQTRKISTVTPKTWLHHHIMIWNSREGRDQHRSRGRVIGRLSVGFPVEVTTVMEGIIRFKLIRKWWRTNIHQSVFPSHWWTF